MLSSAWTRYKITSTPPPPCCTSLVPWLTGITNCTSTGHRACWDPWNCCSWLPGTSGTLRPGYLCPERDPWQLTRVLRQQLTLYRDEAFGSLPLISLNGLSWKESTLLMRVHTNNAFMRPWLTKCAGQTPDARLTNRLSWNALDTIMERQFSCWA